MTDDVLPSALVVHIAAALGERLSKGLDIAPPATDIGAHALAQRFRRGPRSRPFRRSRYKNDSSQFGVVRRDATLASDAATGVGLIWPGAFLITQTMGRLPDIGFESYDRFVPSQDTLLAGGFGNLIALPLQGLARSAGNSVFIDEAGVPC